MTRSRRTARLLSVLLLVATASCQARASTERRTRVDRTVLTRDQMLEHSFATAWEAIEALRSNWLQVRGTDSFMNPSEIKVVLDDTHLGGISTLRSIPLSSVVYIRWYDGVAATARWGFDHVAGVIFVSTRL